MLHSSAQRCSMAQKVKSSAQRYRVVHGGAEWCTEMQSGTHGCRVLHKGAGLCTEVHCGTERCRVVHRGQYDTTVDEEEWPVRHYCSGIVVDSKALLWMKSIGQ